VILVPAHAHHPHIIVGQSSTPGTVIASTANTATVTIQVADGATFSVDGKTIVLSGTSQTFNTPALDSNRTYYYEMKAAASKDGKNLIASKRVAVKAGETITVDLRELKVEGAAPASEPKATSFPPAPAKLTIKLPAEAKLFVDGVQAPLTSAERTFETPKLDAGKDYVYTIKAELSQEGRTISETKRVTFQAGKEVTVEFKNLATQSVSR
jgi:uncharacterized protein (TIGR03000 family)